MAAEKAQNWVIPGYRYITTFFKKGTTVIDIPNNCARRGGGWGAIGQNCTFEVDLCGWINAIDDDFNWFKQQGQTGTPHTGPSGDHTIGENGWFVFIDNNQDSVRGETARLVSPDVSFNAGEHQCLTFWYHMHGAHIERLNVYLGVTNDLGEVLWTRRGTQGNEWKKAQITLAGSITGTKSVIFEALQGIVQGDISLDDISLGNGRCVQGSQYFLFIRPFLAPCMDSDYCDFEDGTSLCGGTQDQSDTLDFTLAGGTIGSPPDHTLGTPSGHFLVITATDENRSRVARFITSPFSATSTKCLQFHHIKSGDQNLGVLTVYAQFGGSRGSPLWMRSITQDYGFYEEQVTIYTTSDFEIVFEMERHSGNTGYIGIDDYFIFDGSCSSVGDLPGSCDFEHGMCSWQNVYTDDIDWVDIQGSTATGNTGPQNDHTLGSPEGTYLYFEASNIEIGATAALFSEPYQINIIDSRCIGFWYHMYGQNIGKLTLQQLYHDGDVIDLWTMSGNQGEDWVYAQVEFYQPQNYQLIFNSTRGSSTVGDICLDDISITNGVCRDDITMSCTFESSMCGWTDANDDDFDWIRQQSKTGTGYTGPSGDHTIGENGWFIYIDNTFDIERGAKARIISPEVTFTADESQCLTFWYHMHGAHIECLNFYLADTNDLGDVIWTRRGTQGNEWKKVQITLSANGQKNIVFEAIQGIIQGDIALDDIMLEDGNCFVLDHCDFEDGTSLCGGTQDQSDTLDFTLTGGTIGSAADHTLGTVSGHFLTVSATIENKYRVARFITPTFHASSTKCLQFYHIKSGYENLGVLRVYAQIGGDRGTALWMRSIAKEYDWFEEQLTVETTQDFEIVFEMARGSGSTGFIGIDDYFIFDEKCSSVGDIHIPGSCDFEHGMCSWQNVYTDDMDWVENKGHTGTGGTGPQNDHTLGTQDGTYLYFEASNTPQGAVGALFSEPFQMNIMNDMCINFWYHMYGGGIGTLTVQQLLSNGDVIDLWTMSGDQGNEWMPGRTGYYQTVDYQLIFNATRGGGPSGDISIDDIAITLGFCSSSHSLFDCDFEGDLCGWNQMIDDELDWTRTKGDTGAPHTGPSGDHTRGGNEGYYLYIDNDGDQDVGDAARLESPAVTFEANRPKCFSFWYHMYGAHIGTLSVYFQGGQGLSPIWTRQTTHGDQWHKAKVNLLLTSDDTRSVVIEATQGYRIHGDIAIDDISLEDGYCTRDYYGCDFEDDTVCGGEFDQTTGLTWILSTADNPDGPPQDHTYQTALGHFLLVVATATNTGQVARYLTATTTTTYDRCLEFYYAAHDTDIGVLSIRTVMDGHMSHPLWIRYLQISNRMSIGQVSIKQQTNFQIVFELVRHSGTAGYLALDDIELLDDDCPNPTYCNFESGKCTWMNEIGVDQLDWVLNKGTTSTGGTGPQTDHTTGSDQGTYLYMEGSNTEAGTFAVLFGSIQPAILGYKCLEFWYHMSGIEIGSLQVDIIDSHNFVTGLWLLSGDQGTIWQYGRIAFTKDTEYQLLIVATRGVGPNSDIAIDDIIISEGECSGLPVEAVLTPPSPAPSGNPCGSNSFTCDDGTCIPDYMYCDFVHQCPDKSDETSCPANCNFEQDECGWYEGTSDDNFNWYRASASDTRHTPDLAPSVDHTHNSATSYFVYIAPVGMYSNTQTAEYMSPLFSSAAPDCRLDLWIYVYGASPRTLQIYLVQEETELLIWSSFANFGDQWNNFVIGIGRQVKPWQLDLAYGCKRSSVKTQFLCHFDKLSCSDKKVITQYLISLHIQKADDFMQCNFENGLCNWTQATDTDELDWIRINGPTPSGYSGPIYDHTYSNDSGNYMYLDPGKNQYGYTAQLISPIFSSTECTMRFFYHMYGKNMGSLNIYTRIYSNTNQGQTRVWQQIGENGAFWDRGTITFGVNNDFQVVIEGVAGDYDYGYIGLDDFTFTSTCEFSSNGNLPPAPPTTPPPFLPSTTLHPVCKTGEFYCTADNVCIAPQRVCNFRSDCSDGEEETKRCMNTACDFEDDMCGWNGAYTGSQKQGDKPLFVWDRQQGNTAGPNDYRPLVDHTSKTGDGFYLFADNSPGSSKDTTDIYTPWIGQTGPNCYLEFWFHMAGTNEGSLQVFTQFGDDMNLKYTLSDNNGDEWKQALVFIGTEQNIKILIRASRGTSYAGDTCIDDIVFEECAPPTFTGNDCTNEEFRCANGFCIDKKKVCNFVDDCMDNSDEDHCDNLIGRCDFEFDFCDWKQEYDDQFDWMFYEGSTSTYKTGPITDHTIRSPEGQYMYIEGSYPQLEFDKARLASPSIRGNSKECRISLWYHMYGEGVGSLVVFLRTSYLNGDSGLQVLHNITGDQGDYWWPLDVTIESRSDFKIVLEAMIGSHYAGDIAVDDVSFSGECIGGGSIPGEMTEIPLPTCDEDERMLSCEDNLGCFYSWQRCNFIADCQDSSDENNCGHYMYINTNEQFANAKAHLQTLPYSHSHEDCQLKFWYHMYGKIDGESSLSVFVKYGNHQTKELWYLEGNQGDEWHEGTALIGRYDEFSISFEGKRGSNQFGDIAIDDLQFENCADVNYVRPCDETTEFECQVESRCLLLNKYCDYKPDCQDGSDEVACVVKPGDCHFDYDKPYCDYEQLDDDDFDWIAGITTPSDFSGPDFDHTAANTSGNSNFLYVDSSAQEEGQIARIATPMVFPASINKCTLRFWYHMFSDVTNTIGILRVYTESDVINDQRLFMWQVGSNMGKHWNYANVVLSNPHSFRVVFEVIMGEKKQSDIAIDDITFTMSCLYPENPGYCLRNQLYCPGDQICIDISWLNDGNIDCPTDCYDEEQFRFNCDVMPEPSTGDDDSGADTGLIVGAVLGGVVVFVVVILLVAFVARRLKDKGAAQYFSNSHRTDKVRLSELGKDEPDTNEFSKDYAEISKEFSIDNPVYDSRPASEDPATPTSTMSQA
ncbi:MAM and LDL-receptor class A domain-containing protein 1-like [Saccoglossus kowalevskii]